MLVSHSSCSSTWDKYQVLFSLQISYSKQMKWHENYKSSFSDLMCDNNNMKKHYIYWQLYESDALNKYKLWNLYRK